MTAISGTLAAAAITPPHIEYGQLLPMLLVFGVAVAGTLVGLQANQFGIVQFH